MNYDIERLHERLERLQDRVECLTMIFAGISAFTVLGVIALVVKVAGGGR